MSMSETEKRELEGLLHGLCEESLDEAGLERLSVLLAAHDEAQRAYIEFLDLHAALAWEFAGWGRAAELEAADAWLDRTQNATMLPMITPPGAPTCGSGFLASLASGRAGQYTRAFRRRSIAVSAAVVLAVAASVVLLVYGLPWKSKVQGPARPALVAEGKSSPQSPPKEVSDKDEHRGVARVGRLSGVRWAEEELKLTADQRLAAGQDIKLEAGRAEINFDIGAQMVVEGPAHVRILGPLQARAYLGTIAAHVDKNAHGFSIVTPQGKVVDLGTQFGLRVDRSGQEEIAVFEGQVDIDYPHAARPAVGHSGYPFAGHGTAGPSAPETKRRLTAGEAVCVNREGELTRLPAISNETFPRSVHASPARPPVIELVADNVRLPESAQFYEIVHGGLDDGAQCYVDRTCKWRSMTAAGLPDGLRGADYVKTFNNDKLRQDYELNIQLACPADLYVFTDDRVMAPDWVRASFQPTGWKIGMEEAQMEPRDLSALSMGEGKNVSYVFSVWRLSVPSAQTVKLGRLPTYPTGETQGLGLNWTSANMYGIAVVSREQGVASREYAGSPLPAPRPSASPTAILQSRSLDSIISELGEVPRPEHPRPDQYRGDWHNLNGVWEFAFDRQDQGRRERWQDKADLPAPLGTSGGRKIVVPFAPESVLSGIHDEGFHPLCWYARNFDVPASLDPRAGAPRRVLLHFGAVDYRAEVWLNGRRLGDHEGGYDPFDFDVTDIVKPSVNRLVVRVQNDPTEPKYRGKQSPDLHPSGSVYSRVSGIWQTVWLEAVGSSFARDWTIRADADTGAVAVDVHVDGPVEHLRVEAHAALGGQPAGDGAGNVGPDKFCALALRVARPAAWTPDTPNLYDLDLRLVDDKGREIDGVRSYFGFRKLDVRDGQYLLGGKPFFLISALDQGYNPAGLYTPPSDDFQREDVLWAKRYGLNNIRKHQIVPEPRFFYWCDRLGLTVWAEMADWGCGIGDCEGFLRQWRPRVKRDINHPSIITWVPLNEQRHDSKLTGNMVKIYEETRRIDPTRPVLDNSGWGHARTDITDLHTNETDFRDWWEKWRRSITEHGNFWLEPGLPAFHDGFHHRGQPVVISEVGLWRIDGFGPLGPWTEYGSTKVPTVDAYLDLYCDVIVGLMSEPGCAGFSYVQLYDVEGEVNGYLTYDRRPKVPPEVIRAIHAYGLGRHWAARQRSEGQMSDVGDRNSDLWPLTSDHRLPGDHRSAAVPAVQTLVPSSRDEAQTWRFTTETPKKDWTATDFDDSAWQSGPGGFGTFETPGAVVRTVWDTPDIWIRRSFEISEADHASMVPAGGKLFLELHHDEDAEIYINGTRIKTVEGFVTRYLNLPLDDSALKALRRGRNTIAVHCRNTSGGQYIDVGVNYVRIAKTTREIAERTPIAPNSPQADRASTVPAPRAPPR